MIGLKRIVLEQLIFENRIDDAKNFVIKDFKNTLIPPSRKEGEVMPMWFQYLVENDPSGNQKYLMWVLKQIKKNRGTFVPFGDYGYFEEQLVKIINDFHDLQNILTAENIKTVINWKAISRPETFTVVMDDVFNRYPMKYLDEILKKPKDIDSYKDYNLLGSILNAIQEIASKTEIKKEGIRLDTDDWIIVYPTTWRVSCFYGAGTRWCTTERSSDVNFNKHQTKTSSLFYIIPKKTPKFDVADYFTDYQDDEYDLSKIALHITTAGNHVFYDASDADIEPDVMENLIGITFGGEYTGSFEEAVNICQEFHEKKIKKSI